MSCYVVILIIIGVGDFNLDPYGCLGPNLYMIVRDIPQKTEKWTANHSPSLPIKAPPLRLVTSPVPNKPPPFCILKSTNYLQNAHAVMDAHERGADFGIFVYDSDTDVNSNNKPVTLVAEGPNCNVTFIDKNGKFVVPKFVHSLRGVTLLRAIDLIEKKLEKVRMPLSPCQCVYGPKFMNILYISSYSFE